jgi:phospholipase D1/2
MGEPVLDVARHFCERWNFVKHDKAMKKDNVPFLQPPLGGMGFQQRFIDEPVDGESHRFRRYRHKHHISGVTGSMRAQVLRSSAKWSSGIDTEVKKKKKKKIN